MMGRRYRPRQKTAGAPAAISPNVNDSRTVKREKNTCRGYTPPTWVFIEGV